MALYRRLGDRRVTIAMGGVLISVGPVRECDRVACRQEGC